MRTKIIEANGVKLLLVEVPGKSYQHILNEDGNLCGYIEEDGSIDHIGKIEISYQTELLGTITEGVVEFDVSGLVESGGLSAVAGQLTLVEHFKNYNYVDWRFAVTDCKYSFITLLEANGILTKNPIKPEWKDYDNEHNKGVDVGILFKFQQADERKWQEKEKEVWHKIVCLKIK